MEWDDFDEDEDNEVAASFGLDEFQWREKRDDDAPPATRKVKRENRT